MLENYLKAEWAGFADLMGRVGRRGRKLRYLPGFWLEGTRMAVPIPPMRA